MQYFGNLNIVKSFSLYSDSPNTACDVRTTYVPSMNASINIFLESLSTVVETKESPNQRTKIYYILGDVVGGRTDKLEPQSEVISI